MIAARLEPELGVDAVLQEPLPLREAQTGDDLGEEAAYDEVVAMSAGMPRAWR